MKIKTSHKVGLIIAGGLAILSWAIAIYFWGKLPDVIPTHFGFNGLPDAYNNKSIWYVFLMPAMQIIMLGGFIFLYYKPQYSDIPTTLWLTTLPEKKKEHAFNLIRTMLIGISLWIGVLFTYLTLTMNLAAFVNNVDKGGYYTINPFIMFGLMGGMFAWLIWWTVKVYRATRDAIAATASKK